MGYKYIYIYMHIEVIYFGEGSTIFCGIDLIRDKTNRYFCYSLFPLSDLH